MKITSSAFGNNWRIPSRYTCDDLVFNPPLSFSEVPANTKSLALVVNDTNAPAGLFVHWILFNIDPKINEIKENSVPENAILGNTSTGIAGYVGICPPAGETHRYRFSLYALDTILNLKSPDISELNEGMSGHIIEQADLEGLYSRV